MVLGYASRAGLTGSSSAGKPSRESLDTLPVLDAREITARAGGDLLSDAERAATQWVAHQPVGSPSALARTRGAEPQPRWGHAVAPSQLDVGERRRPASANASEYHQHVAHSAPVEVARERAAGRVLAMRGGRGGGGAQQLTNDIDLATDQQLELSDADFAEPAVAAVAAALAGNRSLISLDLSGAGRATQHSMAVLLLALEEHPSLSHLDVHGLPLHPKNLSDFLRRNERLESLDLYGCYDAREELTDGCWVALRYDLHEHGDLVAMKGDIVCAQRDHTQDEAGAAATSWRVHGAAVPACQLRRACFSAPDSLALLSAGLRANRGLLHVNLALHGSASTASLAPAILAHPKLVSFNSVPLRAPPNTVALASHSEDGGGRPQAAFALSVAHLAGLTEMSLLAERWLAPPLGQAPITRAGAEVSGGGGYSFASLVELRLDGSGGGLDSGAMQLLFQGLTRQGRRYESATGQRQIADADTPDSESSGYVDDGGGGGGAAVLLQTLVVDGAVVPAESVACVLRSHSGLRTLELSGVTDSPYASGMPHPADLAAVLRSLAQTADGHDQGTTGLWLQEVGVSQRLQQLRYVRRVNALVDYSNHPGLDGKPPPHPQRRLPRRVWLSETAQQARRPSPKVSQPLQQQQQHAQGPLPQLLKSGDGVVVVTIQPDPDEGLGLVLEDEAETNNAFVKELLDNSKGQPGAAEKAGLALGAVVVAVDAHSVLGLGCVAVAAKVKVARAAGRAVMFTMGAGEDARLGRLRTAAAAEAAGAAERGTHAEGHHVALTQSVRDGPSGLERRPSKKSVGIAVEDLQPAGYSGQRALSVLGAALRENRSLTSLSITVNPSVIAPRPATLLDGLGQRRRRERQTRGTASDAALVVAEGDEDDVDAAGREEESNLASGSRHAHTVGGTALADAAVGLPHWALSWNDVGDWADAIVANVSASPSDDVDGGGGGGDRGGLRLYNGLELTSLRGDAMVELDLRRRLIGGDGALLLSRFLPDMVQLRRLVLSECALPAVGTAAILETLRAPRGPEKLALDACAARAAALEARLERLHKAAMLREEEAQRNRGKKLGDLVDMAWPERARHDVLWPETSVADPPPSRKSSHDSSITDIPFDGEASPSAASDVDETATAAMAALEDEGGSAGGLSFEERSSLAVDALSTKAARKRKAKTLARRAADEYQATPLDTNRWDTALALIDEAGSLDPDSEAIAEEDAVITRLALAAMDPSHHTHDTQTYSLGRYNRFLKELDLRGCTVDVNQLNRLLAWRTAHADRYDHRQAPSVNILFEARWLLGPLVQAETVAAQSRTFAHQSAMAIRIQALARGWAARALRRRQLEAAIRSSAARYIQGWLRATWLLRRLRREAEERRRQAAAAVIQRCWRGRAGRACYRVVRAAWLAALRAEATAAATEGVEALWEIAWQRIAHRELWGITAEEDDLGNDEDNDDDPAGHADARGLIAAAMDLSDDCDWEGALELFSRAASAILAESPEDEAPDAELAFALHRGSGECHLGAESWSLAAASFAAALAERPGDGAALHGRGCARWGEGRGALAWADFHRAVIAGYDLADGPCGALTGQVAEEERRLALEMSHRDDTDAATRTAAQRVAAARNREEQAAAARIQRNARRHAARKQAQQEVGALQAQRALGQQLESLLAAQTPAEKEAETDVRALLGVPLPRKLWQQQRQQSGRLAQPRQQPPDTTASRRLPQSRQQQPPPQQQAVAPRRQTPAERALAMLEDDFDQEALPPQEGGEADADGEGTAGVGRGEGDGEGDVVQPWVGVWRP
jgi:hypothetical protein